MSPLVLATAVLLAAAPGGPPMDAASLAHAVDRLGSTVRVLYVAAHPDDENTRLLAYLANAAHVTPVYLSMTRGGGGQNLIGPEQGELLDVIRTHELLAARRIDAAGQRFTRMPDFGYSKSAEETLKTWGRDAALADVVGVIRAFQPDVVITRFHERPPNHGHHTASAILAREALAAASDPKRFPEQLARGAGVWRVERLLHNVSTFRDEPVPEGALVLDAGAYDPRTGLSMGEIAARSRTEHRSQGFGSQGERGELIERFVPVAGSRPARDLLEGLPASWEQRFGKAGAAMDLAAARARQTLERDRPEAVLPALREALAALEKLPDAPRVREARLEVERLMLAAAGVFARVNADRPTATPGESIEASAELIVRRPVAVGVRGAKLAKDATFALPTTLAVNVRSVAKAKLTLPKSAPVTAGDPEGPPAVAASFELDVEGARVTLSVPLTFTFTDRVYGERVRDFVVAPPATVTPARDAILAVSGKAAPLVVRVRAWRDGLRGRVGVEAPAGVRVVPERAEVSLEKAGDEVLVSFEVSAKGGAVQATLRPHFVEAGTTWSWRADVIDYPHVPYQVVLRPARVGLAVAELTVPEGTIGYVPGSGDSVADDLAHVGARVELLDEGALRYADLSRFTAIVLGIRAYNTQAFLPSVHARLMSYVEAGGVVVTQYNTNSRWSRLEVSVGPYPLTIGRERITDERAAVTFVDPSHELVTTPHRLGSSDFQGWVQERGLYFAQTWDARFQPVLRMADPGEAPLEGGVLAARHGRGRFVYTGLAFFRQLPAGVPGAYRLLLNLLTPPGATAP